MLLTFAVCVGICFAVATSLCLWKNIRVYLILTIARLLNNIIMRTSYQQYALMIDFMEKHGDLSKPSGGPRGRHYIQVKWKELTKILNSDGTGNSRTEEKWRKVWSDLKNNTKKKAAKINRAATGGGPAVQLSLTALEDRVLNLIKVQAATGIMVLETVSPQTEKDKVSPLLLLQPEQSKLEPVKTPPQENTEIETIQQDWNTAGTSSQPSTASQSPTASQPSLARTNLPDTQGERQWRPPQKKQKRVDIAKLFVEWDKNARHARERDRAFDRLEMERLRQRDEEIRLKELELHERARQRDVELQLQAQWLEFLKEAMNVIIRCIEREDRPNS